MLPGRAAQPRGQEQALVAPDEPERGDVGAAVGASVASRGGRQVAERPPKELVARIPHGDEARHRAERLDAAGLEDVGVQRRDGLVDERVHVLGRGAVPAVPVHEVVPQLERLAQRRAEPSQPGLDERRPTRERRPHSSSGPSTV